MSLILTNLSNVGSWDTTKLGIAYTKQEFIKNRYFLWHKGFSFDLQGLLGLDLEKYATYLFFTYLRSGQISHAMVQEDVIIY